MIANEKRCVRCEKIKPFSEFYKSRTIKSGYQSYCKDCARSYAQTQSAKESRKCYNRSDRRKQSAKKYRDSKKGQDNARRYRKIYNQTEKAKLIKRRYETSEIGRQKKSNYSKLYSQRDYVKKKRRERKKSYFGRQKSRIYSAIRRSRQRNIEGSYTLNEWYNLCRFYEFRCLKCKNEHPFNKLTVDHVKPISKGGTNFIWNLQPLCLGCNSSKRDKEIDYRKILPDWIKRNNPVWIQDRLF